jgi:hypothetical protein
LHQDSESQKIKLKVQGFGIVTQGLFICTLKVVFQTTTTGTQEGGFETRPAIKYWWDAHAAEKKLKIVEFF